MEPTEFQLSMPVGRKYALLVEKERRNKAKNWTKGGAQQNQKAGSLSGLALIRLDPDRSRGRYDPTHARRLPWQDRVFRWWMLSL